MALPSATDTNDYVDGSGHGPWRSGALSVTLERTGSLGDLDSGDRHCLLQEGCLEVDHDDTLFGDGTTTDPLGVSAHDVLEQFAESVQVFHGLSTSLNTGNFAAKGPRFTTGNYDFHVTAVEMEYNPGNVEYFRSHRPAKRYEPRNCRRTRIDSPHYQDTGTYITKKMKFQAQCPNTGQLQDSNPPDP